ncbi:MAG: Hsp20/alpha crystallin family protein [Aggregatilineales bacterium]
MTGIVRWNPFREMAAMQNMMDRIFEETWRPFFEEGSTVLNTLALDLHEEDTQYIVTTELPGVKAENIHVKLDGDYLMIEGEIPEQVVEKEGRRSLIKERRYGRFSRRMRLPQSVDSDKVSATYENGVLTLTLPKSEAVQPKQIPVRVSDGSK